MSEEKHRVESDESGLVEGTEGVGIIDERKLLRKIDLYLLPGLALLLILSSLDQSNGEILPWFFTSPSTHPFFFSRKCSYRRSDRRHTHEYVLSVSTPCQRIPHRTSKQAGDQFLTTLTVSYIGFILFKLPSNIILKLTSPRLWLPTLTVVWGISCTLTGLTQNFGGFLTARLFLGMAESGYFPGVAFYLSMWYKRNEQLYRVSMIISIVTLGSALGGLFVSYVLLCLRENVHNASGIRPCQNEGNRRFGWMEVDLYNCKSFCTDSRHGS